MRWLWLANEFVCKGGLVKKLVWDQHRDHCESVANLAWNDIGIESITREANPAKNTPPPYAEHKMYSKYGIWAVEKVGSFDNRIINADALSYAAQDWLIIARDAAEQKHQKYDIAAEDVGGSITPLI